MRSGDPRRVPSIGAETSARAGRGAVVARGAIAGGAIALAALGGCGDDARDVCSGGWHVCRGQIRDVDGRAVVLRGVNFSGDQKAKPYIDAFTQEDYTRLRRDWGLDGIRFVMTWDAVEPAEGQFDDAYLDQVAQRMDWAAQAGLAVVLDMHQDVFGVGFGFDGAPRWACDEARYAAFTPRQPWSLSYEDANVVACFDRLWTDDTIGGEYAAAWAHVAARLAGSSAVIGFDPINEPHWGSAPVWTFERDRLAPFYQRVIAAVRAQAPAWLVFAEPASSRNFGIETSLPRLGDGVVYAPHSYDPQAEQSQGWTDAHRQGLIDNIAGLRAEAEAMGAALWIGEYGSPQSDPMAGAYLDAGYDGAAAVAASSMLWDYAKGGYGLIDASGAEIPAMVDAVARPYPARVAGDLSAWSYDDAARVLTVAITPRSEITAPTQLIAPARVYPAGPDVACGGCAAVIDGDVVSVPAGTTMVTLSPKP